jgi:glycosyltransferase involved in cell wall biosynthesis
MLTYKSATQSGVVSISYHYDLPVVVTDVGGLKETVEPYNSGEVAEVPTIESIKEATERFFANDQNIYQKGIDLIKQKSSWESLATTISKFYLEV